MHMEEYMVITDIKVRKLFDEGPMKAIVSVTFDDQLALHDIKVISVRDKNFIVMPSRKNPDGTYRDIVHPINAAFRGALEEAVLQAYEAELARAEAEKRFQIELENVWSYTKNTHQTLCPQNGTQRFFACLHADRAGSDFPFSEIASRFHI